MEKGCEGENLYLNKYLLRREWRNEKLTKKKLKCKNWLFAYAILPHQLTLAPSLSLKWAYKGGHDVGCGHLPNRKRTMNVSCWRLRLSPAYTYLLLPSMLQKWAGGPLILSPVALSQPVGALQSQRSKTVLWVNSTTSVRFWPWGNHSQPWWNQGRVGCNSGLSPF